MFAADKILDALSSSVVVCLDANHAITYLNSTGETLFAASAVSIIGKFFDQLLSSVEANTIRDNLQHFSQAGQPITEHKANLTLANGDTMLIDYSINPLDTDHHPDGILIEIRPSDRQDEIARDISRHLQQQVSQQFARGVAHEIKNPLGSIRGAAQLLEKALSAADLKEFTTVIISEVDRLQVLIDNMLGPAIHIHKHPVNILEVLEHIGKLLQAAEPDRFEFRRDYDPSIPEIMADRDLLIQAFLNLALNAVQALDGEFGQITFKTRIDRQITIGKNVNPLVLQVDIIDTGKGIAENLCDTLFLPMVTDKAEGSGLGLPIAQAIISRHGGIVKVEQAVNGTVFRTLLPLEQV